ncbi:MAG: asparaginase [Pseudomonadota bacterium]
MDEVLVTLTRGGFDESVHRGHAVLWHAEAGLVASWGDADAVILPRSSCKMIQALPLVESGAADRAGIGPRHLALACASHNGAAIHTDLVTAWLADLGLREADLRCGPQTPTDRTARAALICSGTSPDQRFNNCSGKHAGFLTLARDLGAGREYIDPSHPVQLAVRTAFEELTELSSPGYGIDGCSAPNFATTTSGLARSMAWFAAAASGAGSGVRDGAMAQLYAAMIAHPDLVAGEGRACTRLMRALSGRGAVKTGAEGVFIAILPDLRMGLAVKCSDGATRAAEAVTAEILARLEVLPTDSDVYRDLAFGPIKSRRGLDAGAIRLSNAVQGWTP